MNRIFRIEFRRGFYSVGFYLSILLLAAAGWISAGDILGYLAGVEYIEGGIRFLEAAYQALCSEPFALLVPVACTLAMSAAYGGSAELHPAIYSASHHEEQIPVEQGG